MSAQAQRLVRSASDAGKKVLENPQVKQAVEQATVAGHQANRLANSHYAALMKKNSHYILGNGPNFFVTKQNIHKVALFTALAEIPVASKACTKEAAIWRNSVWNFIQKPGEAVTMDIARAGFFALELLALFKVGEFVGRGFTVFGYWP